MAITVAAIVRDTLGIGRAVPATAQAIRAMVVRQLIVPAIVLPLQLFLQAGAIARMLQVALPVRGQGGAPTTLPATPGNRPNQTPSTRPSTNEARGYQRPQTSSTGAAQAARPNAFSGSGGGRAQSARGNRSLAAKGGRGGR